MKKTVVYLALIALVAAGFTACGNSTEQTEATATTYNLDGAKNELKWQGDYADGSHSHKGTVEVTAGTLVYNGDTFESGSFAVDLKTVKNDLTSEMGSEKLNGHLASPDFFNTAEFPTVEVVVNAVSEKEIDATLKVAGKEVAAKMPVTVKKSADKVTLKGNFKVDFSSMDVNGFKANPENGEEGKDKFVKPEVGFELNLTLKAAK